MDSDRRFDFGHLLGDLLEAVGSERLALAFLHLFGNVLVFLPLDEGTQGRKQVGRFARFVRPSLGQRESLIDMRGLIGAYQQIVDFFADGGDEAQLAAHLQELEARRGRFDLAALDDLGGLLDDTVFGIGQISELVGSLKDFSRLDQAQVARVDVHQLIDGALKIGGNILRKKNIEVVRQFGAVPEIVCSPAQINQVLLNLITNAAQAIAHEHGRISVRTHAVGQYLMIAVEDNGAGIPAEHLARIFDPFFTTKPVGQGTGLGLSICYQIIEQHRGRIRAVSTPGIGTRFFVALPVRGRAEEAA